MKLLIVDDSAMMREAIASSYQGSVFTEIETAVDGLQAVETFRKFAPDVVTLDITMPHMDGLAAMSEMLSIDSGATILIVSALADSHTAIQALKRGAHQFICKPFSAEDLKAALDEIIKDKQERKPKVSPASGRLKLKNTMAHTHQLRPSSGEASPNVETPTSQQYPSGFVQPPKLDKPSKETSAVKKVMPFKNTYAQLQASKAG